MGLYDYNKVLSGFSELLDENCKRANLKKEEYLDKIIMIFKQFVGKCEKEIDHIIAMKIDKLSRNYHKVCDYFQTSLSISQEKKNLVIAEFLIKPFEKFPFAGNKNEKLFKEQYNLIEKASVLIEQTLIQSFNEDEVPTFENQKFFHTIEDNGIGQQSLTKLRLNPSNFSIKALHEITPVQQKVESIKLLNHSCLLCLGDQNWIEVWDILDNFCLRKVYIDIPATISTALIFKQEGSNCLVLGFDDGDPCIVSYRLDTWTQSGINMTQTKKITKLLQFNDYLISGSGNGSLCAHTMDPIKTIVSQPHISGIEDIIAKNTFIYVLQKTSNVLEYEVKEHETDILVLNFRRSISAGYISMIRFPELTTNFSGLGCHIYGLSQIEITRKFKIQQTNIINVPEMISDFIVLESKETSEFFALCVFQNSSTIRIYSLTSQEQVYESATDYGGEVGTADYLPKIQISSIEDRYILTVVNQSEFEDEPNIIKVYELIV